MVGRYFSVRVDQTGQIIMREYIFSLKERLDRFMDGHEKWQLVDLKVVFTDELVSYVFPH